MFLANLVTSEGTPMGAGTRNRIIEWTQAALAALVLGAFVYASVMSLSGAENLKEITLIIVTFYFAKRSDFSATGNGSKV